MRQLLEIARVKQRDSGMEALSLEAIVKTLAVRPSSVAVREPSDDECREAPDRWACSWFRSRQRFADRRMPLLPGKNASLGSA
jgi:hypothetical protein